MGLVVVFVLCQSFTMVTDVFELFCTLSRSQNSGSKCLIPKQVNNLISCGHFMLAVNSTVNFVFYMIYIKEFRDSFLKVRYSLELLLKSYRTKFSLYSMLSTAIYWFIFSHSVVVFSIVKVGVKDCRRKLEQQTTTSFKMPMMMKIFRWKN